MAPKGGAKPDAAVGKKSFEKLNKKNSV